MPQVGPDTLRPMVRWPRRPRVPGWGGMDTGHRCGPD